MAKKDRPQIIPEDNYRTIPALARYIDRIGAEQLNFRRFMVREYNGHYYTERSLITIEDDGSVRTTTREHAPSKKEEEDIKSAFAKLEFPKAITCRNIDALLKVTKATAANMFEFIERRTGEISFVQERRLKEDGTKAYIPWTYFSDGNWRSMEPDSKLPFWKPKKKTSSRIMIHEGAKAARHVDWMVNSKEPEAAALRLRHPWASELADYEHWGMIGGALAPHRSNYSELLAEKPSEVIYICDNDHAGKKVISEISRHYGQPLKHIKFDDKWPPSFDLADPFEASASMPQLFSASGRYKGQTLKQMLQPATWATTKIIDKDGKATKDLFACTNYFSEEWYHSIRPDVFLHRDRPNQILTPEEFNDKVMAFSDSKNTALVLKKDDSQKGYELAYEPGIRPGVAIGKQGPVVNTFYPSEIKAEKGDMKLWEDYIEHLFPIKEDRIEAMRWCATLIARPETKMQYGMLLISTTQGVGKTTLGQDILSPLVGEWNVSYPTESDIVDSNFNYWIAHKRLAIVNEIYAGHSSKGYDRLKSVITDDMITVSKKYQANYEIRNWLHMFACSNSERALKLEDTDRRWFVPTVVEQKHTQAWWNNFHDWLDNENGLGKIKFWAEQFLKKNKPVMKGDSAPITTRKRELAEEGMSPGIAHVSGLLDHLKTLSETTDEPFFITDIQLQESVLQTIYDGKTNQFLERPLTLRRLARNKGWFEAEKVSRFPQWNHGKWKARVLFPRLDWSQTSIDELWKNQKVPKDISKLSPM